MRQRLGDNSSIEVWTEEDASGPALEANGLGDPQEYAFVIHHNNGLTIALNEEEFILLKMGILFPSAELKRELLRFVQFIESMGVLPAQQASLDSELRGKLIQYYRSFEQLVDMAIEFDQVDWYKLAQENGETEI